MDKSTGVIIAVVITSSVGGVAVLVIFVILLIRFCRNRSAQQRSVEPSMATLPIRSNGFNATSIDSSISISISGSINEPAQRFWGRQGQPKKDIFHSASGIPRYSYKDIRKATDNFTTVLGQGSFGAVYKATMPAGEIVAVKVLAVDSRQGEREFQTEVSLLSRLHHRNLVNLVGYCIDKGQRILVYEYMSNGSLASLLYGDNKRNLRWEERLQIALDISHGVEYLHEGAVPPVIHRDLKSANILLDKSMRAKVADFGLSKEDVFDERKSGLKGTYGYIDPEYMSTRKFTKKSDVYSFGIILLELVTAINPQHGLMEYIDLASIGGDGNVNWDEILDKDLVNSRNLEDVKSLAEEAYRCVDINPRKRPFIADVTQAIGRIKQQGRSEEDSTAFSRNHDLAGMRRIEQLQLEQSRFVVLQERARAGT